MFVGHYAAAFALKRIERKAPLAALFLAVQWVDILFFPLAVLGVEKMEFVENFTAVNDFNLYFYPYTHGLLGSVVWSAIIFLLVRLFWKDKPKSVASILALAVLSHWFLDLIVHTADLPILADEPKFGFGFWNSKVLTFWTESILLLVGFAFYQTKLKSQNGKKRSIALLIILLLVGFLNIYILPKNNNLISLTSSALASYFLFALLARWVEKS